MTEILLLALLCFLALAGTVWTVWDIRSDLRRRRPQMQRRARLSRKTQETPPAKRPAGFPE